MQKLDHKKILKDVYSPSPKQPAEIDVPQMNFIKFDGKGAPESSAFASAISTLFPIAYEIKFEIKKSQNIDYKVMPLEGLWWADDMEAFRMDKRDKSKWKWTLMIMQPDMITAEIFNVVLKNVATKKPLLNTDKVRFESFKEGKAIQIMHIGPFSDEGPNIEKLHNRIQDIGGKLTGLHHEIYLSDFRKANPEKLKTVLRQPYSL